jgi:phosphocarrier protein
MRQAVKFKSDINISVEGQASSVSAKSLVQILSLAIECNTTLIITAEGEDEQNAVDTLVSIIESGFGESN